MRPRDTSPEIWAIQVDQARQMRPEDRLLHALSLSDMMRAFAEEGIRHRFPVRSDIAVYTAVHREMVGESLSRAALPDQASP